jgi:hypothetical protein
MAEWLADGQRQNMLLVDYLHAFMREFCLKPETAGRIIGQWLKETYS